MADMSLSGTVITDQAVVTSAIPGCNLALKFSGEQLAELVFVPDTCPLVTAETDAAAYLLAQLDLYFRNPNWHFDLSLLPQGTEFQRRVWQALREIPVGTTVTYGQLAWRLESSARAVGGACRNNPVALVVPCHRVVAATGIGGFMGQRDGQQIDVKAWLLGHELKGVVHHAAE